jgi:Peptidase family M48
MVLALNIQGRQHNKEDLWQARNLAMASVYKPWFQKPDEAYVNSIKTTFKGRCLKIYTNLYNTCDHLSKTATKVAVVFTGIIYKGLTYIPGFKRFESGVYKVHNFFFPINPVNGQRGINFFPRIVEKFIGDVLVSPYYLKDKKKTNDMVGTPPRYIDHINQNVLDQILTSSKNQQILNPQGFVEFDYRVFSSKESITNAFALPAGSMLVTSQIVHDLQREIARTQDPLAFSAIKNIEVTKSDGSLVTVDVRGVNLEDALAALIGHEMTHVASRHSSIAATVGFIAKVVFKAITSAAIFFIKSKDASYQRSINEPQANPESANQIEAKYKKLEEIADKGGEWLYQFFQLYESRRNEHEADVTGAYFAMNAGYNPLGALYIQEFLARQPHLPGWFDFISTHPDGEKRKTAVYTALKSLDPTL